MHISYPLLDYSYDYFVKYFKIFKKYMYIYIYIWRLGSPKWSKIVKKLKLTPLLFGHFWGFFKINYFEDFTSNEAQPQLKTLFKASRIFLETFENR